MIYEREFVFGLEVAIENDKPNEYSSFIFVPMVGFNLEFPRDLIPE